jgi:tape measure domain-containing protein
MKAVSIAAAQSKLTTVTDPIKKQSLELGIQRDRLLMSRRALEQNTRAMKDLWSPTKATREAMRDWAMILYPLAKGVEFVWSAVSAVATKLTGIIRVQEDAMLGAKYAFGSSASDMVKMSQDLSVRTGRPVEDLYQQMLKFGHLGAPDQIIRPMMLAISDMQAMGGDAGKLQYVFTQMFSKPVLDINEIRRGMIGIVDETKFWQQLAKDLGVPYANISKMVEQNLIGRQAGVTALLETLQAKEGMKLGKISFERADTTLGGILDRFETKLTQILSTITDTPGFKTFKDALNNLLSVLGEQKTESFVKDIANSLGAMVEPLTGDAGREKMRKFFDDLIGKLKELWPIIKDVAGEIGTLGKLAVMSVEGWHQIKHLGELTPEEQARMDRGELIQGGKPSFLPEVYNPFSTTGGPYTPEAAARVREYLYQTGQEKYRVSPDSPWGYHGPGLHIHTEVHAPGATKDDAEHIASKAAEATKKAVLELHEQINTESGAYDGT